jgi:uncharacterized protein YjiS (DUF1127 family)
MHLLHSSIEPFAIVHLQQKHNCRQQETRHLPPNRRKRKTTTMAFITDNRTATATLADRASALIANMSEVLATRKLYRTTYNELHALTNRELADLGIHRSSIKAIALGATKK